MIDIYVAVVEDEDIYALQLQKLLEKYEEEKPYRFHMKRYSSAMEFIDTYKSEYDLLFLDIKMPGMSGMDMAKELRKRDSSVPIVFVTSLSQYAVEGYEVSAMDYILKPLNYGEFKIKLTRILEKLSLDTRRRKFVVLENEKKAYRIEFSSIMYVETEGHLLLFHVQNENKEEVIFKKYQSMKDAEKILADDCFIRINSSFFVNMNFVESMYKNECIMKNGKALAISRPRRGEVEKKYREFK